MKGNLKRAALLFLLLSISLSVSAQSLDKPKHASAQNSNREKAGVAYSYKEPCDGEYWFSRGYELHQSGHYQQAIDAFAHSVDLEYRQATAIYNIACGFALLNDKESALVWLDRALAIGFNRTDLFTNDSDLDLLRSDPRFKRFLDLAEDHHKDKEKHKQ